MTTSQNFLRLYRKRSSLSQKDIAFLMRLSDYSKISRYEKGQRTPSIELLLVYHHLFDTSIKSFFESYSESIELSLAEQIKYLIGDLKKKDNIPKNISRIRFLEQVLRRLMN